MGGCVATFKKRQESDWSVSEERLEQVREIDGEQAYEKMRRAVEKASQEEGKPREG